MAKIRKNGRRNLNESVIMGGWGGMDNTLGAATFTVHGRDSGYVYAIKSFNDSLQMKPTEQDEEYFIHPGSRVRGVGYNNPDRHYTGKVNRIVRAADGEIVCLYILAETTSKLVSIRADENLELLIPEKTEQIGMYKPSPNENITGLKGGT